MANLHDVQQGSDAWHQLRVGKVTGSRIADLMAQGKSGAPSASRARYMGELIAERLTGVPTKFFKSADMEAGTEKEPEARALYEFRFDVEVKQVGFIDHPRIEMAGCSPDGLVSIDGGVEIKSPIVATHIETLETKKCPGNYLKQIQWNLATSGRLYWDYVSFCPELPEAMRFFRMRIQRDSAMIVEMETQVRKFQADLEAKLATLKAAYMEVA